MFLGLLPDVPMAKRRAPTNAERFGNPGRPGSPGPVFRLLVPAVDSTGIKPRVRFLLSVHQHTRRDLIRRLQTIHVYATRPG